MVKICVNINYQWLPDQEKEQSCIPLKIILKVKIMDKLECVCKTNIVVYGGKSILSWILKNKVLIWRSGCV